MPPESVSAPRTLSTPLRWALQALAGVCVVLGLIGVFVPVLPTIPFLIIAAWAASRSSPRLHGWLLSHPRFGRPLKDWNEAGVVPRRVKWLATAMMAFSAVGMTVVTPAPWVAMVVVLVAAMAAILVWLWRRPERRMPPS
jgi:uncharacterized protein